MKTIIFDDKLKFLNISDVKVRFCRMIGNNDSNSYDYILADIYANVVDAKSVFDLNCIMNFCSLFDYVLDYIKNNNYFEKYGDKAMDNLSLVNCNYIGERYHMLIDHNVV